jgi:hypothetical protein
MIVIVILFVLGASLLFIAAMIPIYFFLSGLVLKRLMRGYDGTNFWRRVDRGLGLSLAQAALLWFIVQTGLDLYDGGDSFDLLEQVIREGLPLAIAAHLLSVGMYYRKLRRWTPD